MAQAKRSVRKSQPLPAQGLRVEGCYNLDTKVVVEWELNLGNDQVRELVLELPTGEHPFDVFRACLSASCMERYAEMAEGVVTNFRLNKASTIALLSAGSELGLVVRADSKKPGPDANIWTRL